MEKIIIKTKNRKDTLRLIKILRDAYYDSNLDCEIEDIEDIAINDHTLKDELPRHSKDQY